MKTNDSLNNYFLKYIDPLRIKRDKLQEKIIKKGIFATKTEKMEFEILEKIYNEKIKWYEDQLQKENSL